LIVQGPICRESRQLGWTVGKVGLDVSEEPVWA